MTAQADPTAARAQTESAVPVLDSAASVPARKATAGRLVFTILAALAVALILNAAVCLLPENSYQRWQLQDLDGRLRWIYERSRVGAAPIDIAIVGPCGGQRGGGGAAVEKDLAQEGKHANVVNFALPG